jgi:hypothetical protein
MFDVGPVLVCNATDITINATDGFDVDNLYGNSSGITYHYVAIGSA